MQTERYITRSSRIRGYSIYLNSKLIYGKSPTAPGDFLNQAYQDFHINYPKFHKMDNMSKLGLLASEILLKDQLYKTRYQPYEMGVLLMNASASLDTDIKYYKTVSEIPSPALFVYTLPNIVIGEICIRNNFKGENAFFVFKQFDATFMAQYVTNLFENNDLEACLCGWVELLEENFEAMMLLVEKSGSSDAMAFSKENINKIYGEENG
ncbi:MAG: hypothetical protein C5B59_01245 [Bacteroidetes bacterium]|nr:MAG: hypothetical protein C5B59_01245 [Bacteroidota bacterium]